MPITFEYPSADKAALETQDARIRAAYARLSDSYQAGKGENAIPLN